eukprot:TRINITY_DN48807_c0_g1_i1.p1 TRINITY_DN48807_c0_g1~~TRINITY_DN48807_c0_g1_i1.p1  ORF type:complete len:415 (-),score=1.91 TRINITY_DN48807_c0_g1_i1:643-1824(-)
MESCGVVPRTPQKRRRSPAAVTPAMRRRLRRDAAMRYHSGKELLHLLQKPMSEPISKQTMLSLRPSTLPIRTVPIGEVPAARARANSAVAATGTPQLNPDAPIFEPKTERSFISVVPGVEEMWQSMPPSSSSVAGLAGELRQQLPPSSAVSFGNRRPYPEQLDFERKSMQLEEARGSLVRALAQFKPLTAAGATCAHTARSRGVPNLCYDDMAYDFYCKSCMRVLALCQCRLQESASDFGCAFVTCTSCGVHSMCEHCAISFGLGGLRSCDVCGGVDDQDSITPCDGASCSELTFAHSWCFTRVEHTRYPDGAFLCRACSVSGVPFSGESGDTSDDNDSDHGPDVHGQLLEIVRSSSFYSSHGRYFARWRATGRLPYFSSDAADISSYDGVLG